MIVSGRMPARSKRSLAQLGKHGAKKLKVHHPDEAPAPATKRCRYGWPAPVAAENAPPSSVSIGKTECASTTPCSSRSLTI